MIPAPPPYVDYIVGLDLGQAKDYTAGIVLQRTQPIGTPDNLFPLAQFMIRWLYRWPLGTPYPNIVMDVRTLCQSLVTLAAQQDVGSTPSGVKAEPRYPLLAVDQTGVGRAVVDMIRLVNLPALLHPVQITGGYNLERGDLGEWHVPKTELIGVAQVLLQSKRLIIGLDTAMAKILMKELSAFKRKINLDTGSVALEAWRQRDHDDCVLAFACAAWIAEQFTAGATMSVIAGKRPEMLKPVKDSVQRRRGFFGRKK